MIVPAATLLPAVAVHVEPAVDDVVQLMMTDPSVHVSLLVDGFTPWRDHVVPVPE